MVVEAIVGENLTQKQEATLSYLFEEDTDLWLVLVENYISSLGKGSEALKSGLINNTDEWKSLVEETKQKNFGELEKRIRENLFEWYVHLRLLLDDAGHLNLLRIYLQTLVNLKIQKVTEVGGRAKLRKQVNAILSAIANDAFSCLNKYVEATNCLSKGKTTDGQNITPVLKAYYGSLQIENFKTLAILIAIVVFLKGATNADDIVKLQGFIRENLIKPLEVKMDSVSGQEKSQARKRLAGYDRLLQAVNISFD